MINKNEMVNFVEKKQSLCIRCGECCRKGGPAMHDDDRQLIESGKIALKYLYTIRKGELAQDNIQGRISPVTDDIIKIKGKNYSWMCIFFDSTFNSCTIYEHRPLECRTLSCWNPDEIKRIYHQNRLTRKDLIQDIKGLWDIVQDHETRCNYDTVRHLINLMGQESNNTKVQEEFADILHYDKSIRSLVVSKGNIDPEITDFLFGRPLANTVRTYFKYPFIFQNDPKKTMNILELIRLFSN